MGDRKKFDPEEYARQKKAELERYKEESPADLVDPDVLAMLQKKNVPEPKKPVEVQPPPPVGGKVPDAPSLPPSNYKPAKQPMSPSFPMAASNPYNLPIRDVVASEGANPILGALKSRMKEMDIDAEKLDRTSSVSNDQKGRYLSQTSKESAARPVTPTSPGTADPLCPPRSPSNFRSSIKGGGNPTGVQGANILMDSLKNRVQGDRMTLGLKQTRGLNK